MKIPFTFIPKLNNLTNCEMKMILWLLERKNALGVVHGVRVGLFQQLMVKQSFYNALKGLRDKEIIHAKHNISSGDYDVIILGGSDSDCIGKDGKERYINLNRKLFKDEKFEKLTSKEKYMLFDLYAKTSVSITDSETKATHKKFMNEFYEKYSEEMKRSKRRIREYLHNIKEFFNINLRRSKQKKREKEWIYVIGRTRSTYKLDKKTSDVAAKERRKHFVQHMFKRHKLREFTDKAVSDVAQLFITYKPENESVFERQLERAIIAHTKDKNKEVSPARIHELLRIELGFPVKENANA